MTALAPPRLPTIGFGRGDRPPQVGREEGGGGAGWVTLARVYGDIEASLLMGRLTEAGLESSSLKERVSVPGWMWGASPPVPVTVLVRRFQLDEARLVLAEVAFAGPAAVAPPPVDPWNRRKGTVLWWLMAVLLGVLFTALAYVSATASAERCRADPDCARTMDVGRE